MEFITKDSGKREEFDTGMKRDTQEGKPRYDLIPPIPWKRLAELYGRGAEKYDPWNWAKGSPYSRFLASLFRHLFQYILGEKDEDHGAAVLFNMIAMMHFDSVGMDYLNDLDSRYNIRPDPARTMEAVAAQLAAFNEETTDKPLPPLTWWDRIKLAVFVLTGWVW